MMFMFAADLGLSSFNAVLIEQGKIKKKKRVFLNERETIEKQIQKFLSDRFFFKAEKIALTGAYSKKAITEKNKENRFKKSEGKELTKARGIKKEELMIQANEIKEKKFILVNEIDAIAKGSKFLSKEKNFLAASVGTGTAFVSVRRNKISHVGGTAIGGKTIIGLSRLITGKSDFREIERKAMKGDYKKIDLMLSDIYSDGIGLLKGNISVSNFGRISSKKEEDLLAGIFNVVCQGISTHTLFAAKGLKHEKVVFSGSLPKTKFFRKTFNEVSRLFRVVNPIFLKNGDYAAASGAALAAKRKNN